MDIARDWNGQTWVTGALTRVLATHCRGRHRYSDKRQITNEMDVAEPLWIELPQHRLAINNPDLALKGQTSILVTSSLKDGVSHQRPNHPKRQPAETNPETTCKCYKRKLLSRIDL